MYELTKEEKRESLMQTWGRILININDPRRKDKRLKALAKKLDKDLAKVSKQF